MKGRGIFCAKFRNRDIASGIQLILAMKVITSLFTFLFFSSASSDKSRRSECCYDRDGGITRAPTRVVANQTKSQNTAASVFIEFREHLTPYLECCVFAADTDACSAYKTLGIFANGSSYIPPNIGKLKKGTVPKRLDLCYYFATFYTIYTFISLLKYRVPRSFQSF